MLLKLQRLGVTLLSVDIDETVLTTAAAQEGA
jgi:hypothetical protein